MAHNGLGFKVGCWEDCTTTQISRAALAWVVCYVDFQLHSSFCTISKVFEYCIAKAKSHRSTHARQQSPTSILRSVALKMEPTGSTLQLSCSSAISRLSFPENERSFPVLLEVRFSSTPMDALYRVSSSYNIPNTVISCTINQRD
jgi:hypothetical protein